jgi:hypothetical protein
MEQLLTGGFDMLDEDFIGELLPLLTEEDIKSARLSCKGWHRSMQNRIRVLKPVHLPDVSPRYPFSSLENLQLPLVRPVQQHLLQLAPSPLSGNAADAAAAPAAEEAEAGPAEAGSVQAFTSLAPLRSLSAAGLQGIARASVLNLTGQELPYDVLKLLSQYMTRFKSLQLDYCKLPAPALLHATGLTSLQSLSLAGIQLQGGLHQTVKDAAAAVAADLYAAAVAAVSAAAAAADVAQRAQQAAPSRLRAAATTNSSSTRQATVAVYDAWVAPQQQQAGLTWQQHPPGSPAFMATSGTLADPADHALLLDAVLLPQLQHLNLDVPARPLVSVCGTAAYCMPL